MESLLRGKTVWIVGSGPSLDSVDVATIGDTAILLNSVINDIRPPCPVIWAAVDRSEMRRHERTPNCEGAILTRWAYREAVDRGLSFDGVRSLCILDRDGPIPVCPGTVTPAAAMCAAHGASRVVFTGFGGVGFSKRLGKPYSDRTFGAVEETFFPSQFDAARKVLADARVPYDVS